MVRISDIARELKVSDATVSNALAGTGRMREETREAIRARAAELGYVPVRRVRRRSGRGLIVIAEDLRPQFVANIIEGIREEAADQGLYPPIHSLGCHIVRGTPVPDEGRLNAAVRALLGNLGCEATGILYVTQYPRAIHGLLDDIGLPVVCVLCTRDDGLPFVHYDDKQGAHLAVSALLDSGCRKVAMISGPIDSIGMIRRTNGCQRALVERGLAFDPSLMKIGDWGVASGYEVARALLAEHHGIDAVFAQNDAMGVGAMHAIREAGLRVPDDVAVVGFDNSLRAYTTMPALTSVAPPFEEMGREALRLAIRLTDRGASRAEGVYLPCALVARGSTRNPL